MTRENPNEPYFKGQEPALCGHYYPDVVRLVDLQKNGKFMRVFDCVHCGLYEREVTANACNSSDTNLDEFREREMKRIFREKSGLEASVIKKEPVLEANTGSASKS